VGLALAAGVLFAVGVVAVSSGNRVPGPVDSGPVVDADDGPVLAVADEDDVDVRRNRASRWRVAVEGSNTFAEAIAWAGPKDVWLWSSLPDEVTGFDPVMTGAFQDMPIIWTDVLVVPDDSDDTGGG
jgi:hypothetical protein